MIKLIDILLEATTPLNLVDIIKKEFDSAGYKGAKSSKHGSHLRYDLGSSKDTESTLSNIFNTLGLDYKITVIDANDFKNGAKSGTYKTYKIDSDNQTVYIVNQQRENSTIVSKSLSPTNLGIVGKTYTNTGSLINTVNSNLTTNKDLLSSLMNDVADNTKKESLDKLQDFKEDIALSSATIDAAKDLSPADINTIGKDFGEILGSIFLLKKVKSPSLEFPSGNNPLIDFIINDYKVSSKYKSGAAATLTDITNGIDKKTLKKQNQKNLYTVLDIIVNKNVSSGYLEVAKYFNLQGIQELSKIMKIPVENITTASINDYIQKTGKEKALKALNPFYKTINRGPKNGEVDWDKLSDKKLYGIVLGPLSYYVVDYLNSNKEYKDALAELLSKIEVKQLYLNIQLGKQKLDFNLKSFSDPNAQFTFESPNQSIYNPDNGRLGFKMK
jgi:hypothetical protein